MKKRKVIKRNYSQQKCRSYEIMILNIKKKLLRQILKYNCLL